MVRGTTATAALEISYFTAGDFDAGAMGAGRGDVVAHRYTAGGFFVVVYQGLDLESTGPLCPGNSLQLSSGAFEYGSNAPTPGADCSSFPTVTEDPEVGVLVCDGVVAYRTAIPADQSGTLFGTLERPVDGGIMGLTSTTPTEAGPAEIDPASLSC